MLLTMTCADIYSYGEKPRLILSNHLKAELTRFAAYLVSQPIESCDSKPVLNVKQLSNQAADS